MSQRGSILGRGPRRTARLVLALHLGALSLPGCTGARERALIAPIRLPSGPLSASSRRLELWRKLQEEDAKIRSLRILHRLSFEQGGQVRGALRGLLAIRKPDAYRLRLVGPGGLTAMDITFRGGRFIFRVPLRGSRLEGDRETPATNLRGVPVFALEQAFLRNLEPLPDRLQEDSRHASFEWGPVHAPSRRLVLEKPELRTVVEARFERGRERSLIEYGAYRKIDGVHVAFHVRFAMPLEHVLAHIRVERATVNPVLSSALFHMSADSRN